MNYTKARVNPSTKRFMSASWLAVLTYDIIL